MCLIRSGQTKESLVTGLLVTPNDVMEDDVWRTSTILVAVLLYIFPPEVHLCVFDPKKV